VVAAVAILLVVIARISGDAAIGASRNPVQLGSLNARRCPLRAFPAMRSVKQRLLDLNAHCESLAETALARSQARVTKPTVKGGLAPANAVEVKGRRYGVHRGVNWQEPISASTGVRSSRSRWIEAVLLGGRIQFTLRCSLRWGAGHRAVNVRLTANQWKTTAPPSAATSNATFHSWYFSQK